MEISAVSHLSGGLGAAAQDKIAQTEAAPLEKTGEGQAAPAPEAPARPRFDRYEEGGGEGPRAGVYSVEPDGAEGYRVSFRPPEEEAADPAQKDGEGKPAREMPERTTVNTDRVDGELRQLERERAELEQQLAQAERTDALRAETLRRQLSAVEEELSRKGSDAYRRSHASVTTE